MGQEDIVNILKKTYPDWVTAKQIIDKVNNTRSSVFKSLKSLQKDKDIDVTIKSSGIKYSSFVTYYRLKEEV